MKLGTGIRFRDPRLIRDYRIWLQYLCWCIQSWMSSHKPILPMFLRVWAYRLGADVSEIAKPLPWPLGEAAMGPFLAPWNRVERFFRDRTGGRSHRCEFTDREAGALYGGQQGPFMNKLFEQLLENIGS
jgi:hypothetical protein